MTVRTVLLLNIKAPVNEKPPAADPRERNRKNVRAFRDRNPELAAQLRNFERADKLREEVKRERAA